MNFCDDDSGGDTAVSIELLSSCCRSVQTSYNVVSCPKN